MTTLGQCLVCGDWGGYSSQDHMTLCLRCEGTGRDPKRGSDWYMDLVLPIQAREES